MKINPSIAILFVSILSLSSCTLRNLAASTGLDNSKITFFQQSFNPQLARLKSKQNVADKTVSDATLNFDPQLADPTSITDPQLSDQQAQDTEQYYEPAYVNNGQTTFSDTSNNNVQAFQPNIQSQNNQENNNQQSFQPQIPIQQTANMIPTQVLPTPKPAVSSPAPSSLQASQSYSIPLNCLDYSFITRKCSKCANNYNVNQNGQCIAQKNSNNGKNDVPQSFDNSAQSLSQDFTSSFQTNTADHSFTSDANVNSFDSTPINQNQSQQTFVQNNQNQNSFSPFQNQNSVIVQSKKKSSVQQNKFPQFPFCDDFFNNQCYACVQGYLLNLIINQCTPYVKPPTFNLAASQSSGSQTTNSASTSSSSASTPSAPSTPSTPSTPASNPQSNCNQFDSDQGICIQCYRNYFFNINTKLCQVVDPLCRTYDHDTGICLTCYTKFTLTKQGKCVNG